MINSDTDVDPQDGAIAGPSGLCKQKLQYDGGKTSRVRSDCQLNEQMSYDDEDEDVTSKVSSSVIIICMRFLYLVYLDVIKFLMIQLMEERYERDFYYIEKLRLGIS